MLSYYITNMNSEKSNVQFHLNILEISGRNITNTYVNDVRRYLDDRVLTYNFDIITNEDFYDVDKHTMRGGRTTFPYIHFEKTFDNVRNTLQFHNKPSKTVTIPSIKNDNYDIVDNPNENVIDTKEIMEDEPRELKEEKHKKETNTIIDRLVSYHPLELNDTKVKKTSIKKSDPIKLDIPSDYSGVIHILLTINMKNNKNIVEGGIKQLNQFLESYSNKKGD